MRLFVALTFDEETRGKIAALQERLGRLLGKGSLAPPENLHLTLAFLGEVAEDDVATVEDALDDVASDPVFELVFEHVGYFGGRARGRHGGGRGRTLWLGCEENARLSRLQADIVRKLRRIGVEIEDHPFTPHVTLARNARLADGADEAALSRLLGEPIAARFSSYSLMESRRKEERVVYDPLCTWE